MRIYCIFSKEAIDLMQGNRGKMAAQAGHAYLHSYWDAVDNYPNNVYDYKQGLARKICLIVPTTEELINIYHSVKQEGYPCTLVRDSGFTVFDKPTITCIGIGPVPQMTFENSKMFI